MGLFDGGKNTINLKEVTIHGNQGYQRKMYSDSLALYNKTKWANDYLKRGTMDKFHISQKELEKRRAAGAKIFKSYNSSLSPEENTDYYTDDISIFDKEKPSEYFILPNGLNNEMSFNIISPIYKKPTGYGLFNESVGTMKPKTIHVTSDEKITMDESLPETKKLYTPPTSYRRTYDKEKGWGYIKETKDKYGEVMESKFMSPKEYFDANITHSNYGGRNMY